MGIVRGYTTPRIRWLYGSCGVGDGGAVGVHGRDLVGAEAGLPQDVRGVLAQVAVRALVAGVREKPNGAAWRR